MTADNTSNGTEDERSGKHNPNALAEVLSSIRELVTAEADARMESGGSSSRYEGASTEMQGVLILTPEMRVDTDRDDARDGEVLSEGIGTNPRHSTGAPILDEEALRGVVNSIVREELQAELGDRISRNLRKLIRRELAQMLDEREAAKKSENN
ncbi:hypothetical protein [Amaricoccus tamworthensis]|uniref:hypothetical protein n=1 Tax=Amaricoccus tamworthensis TaxID=57002 RepID=UPI003C79F63C